MKTASLSVAAAVALLFPGGCIPATVAYLSVPIELTERNTPFFIQKKALRDGSGGPGAQRGGDGQEVTLEHKGDSEIGVIFMAERQRHPAHGLAGGEAGANGEVLIDGAPADVRADHVLQPGQTVTLKLPGGGGYGAV